MSHFTVLVDTGPPASDDGAAAIVVARTRLDELLEPFCESGVLTDEQCAASPYHTLVSDPEYPDEPPYYNNPQSFWDWWVLGGRWRGYLVVRAESHGAQGQPGAFDNDAEGVPESLRLTHRTADIALKADIDDEAMGLQQVDHLTRAFNEHREAIAEGRKPFFWGETDEEKKAVEDDDLDTWLRLKVKPWSTYAMLIDGEYHGGRMGWFGVGDERDDWPTEFRKLYNEIPNDHIVAVVDCHV